MKYLLLILILLFTADHAMTVLKSNQCTDCSLLIKQNDCLFANCFWQGETENLNALCMENTTDSNSNTTNTTLSYCASVLYPSEQCHKTIGCAYLQEACSNFAGCSAYNFNTTAECQLISIMCISGGAGCMDAQACKQYLSVEKCENTPSTSGSAKCIWDSIQSKCRDQICSDASLELNTDLECSNFIKGCVTIGQGCSSTPLSLCSSYLSLNYNCSLLKGSDGSCENNQGSQYCQLKKCETAQINLSKDSQCNSYLVGCMTTGKGCTSSLKPCNTYTENCLNYVGSDGYCETDTITNQCRSRICENGIYTTDSACSQYKQGCKTNGKQCVTTLTSCSQLQGTLTTCEGLIGSDGACKGVNDTEQSCIVQDCIVDSDSTYTTDEQCAYIQPKCVSNGLGCVYQLKACSEQTGDETTCFKLKGSDGNCKKGSTAGQCERRQCSEAPVTYSSDSDCKTYQSTCVSTGNGCIDITTCQLTLKEVSCVGTSGCQWNSYCIDSSDCSQFQTQIVCENYQAISTTVDGGITTYTYQECLWKNNKCQNLLCTDLTGKAYNSNYACQQAMEKCVYNGSGCIDNDSDCTKFIGTQSQCALYGSKCWNDDSAVVTSTCRSRACSDNQTFTTDGECAYFQIGCRTKGQGCIEDTKTCTDYQGAQKQCDAFSGYVSGSSERQPCYNLDSAGTGSNCIPKTCVMAANLTNDEVCGKFMKGCVWDGKQSCLQDTSSCSSFFGTQQQCNTRKGNNQKIVINSVVSYQYDQCYGLPSNTDSSSCKIKECSDNTTAGLTNDQCGQFLSGCVTNSTGCVSKDTTCDLFIGTSGTCAAFLGNGKKCTRMSDCASRLCSDISTPANQNDCTRYHSQCRFKNATSPCFNSSTCLSYVAQGNNDSDKLAYCRAIKDNQDMYCGFQNGNANCQDYTCEMITDETICKAYLYPISGVLRKCYYVNNLCWSIQSCSNYVIDSTSATKPTTDSAKLTWCNSMVDLTNVSCSYHQIINPTKCTYFTICEQVTSAVDSIDCNIQVYKSPLSRDKGCQYYGGKCYSTKTKCTDYSAIGTTNTDKSNFCSALKLNTSIGDSSSMQVISCQFNVGDSNCSSKTCENISSALNQSDCNNNALNCVYYSGKCYTKQDICTSYSTTSISNAGQYCAYMKNSSGEHCAFIDGMTSCIVPSTDCTSFKWVVNGSNPAPSPVPSNNSNKRIYCQARRTGKGKLCGFVYGATSCSIEQNYCELITSPTSQNDCNLQASGCTFIHSPASCATTSRITSCNNVTFDASLLSTVNDKLKYCQSVKSYKASCTWSSTAGACDDLQANCTSISNSTQGSNSAKEVFCLNRFSTAGQCAWKTGDTASTCRALSCFDILNPISQKSCDNIITGCTYYAKSCILTKTDCNLYYAFGADNDSKKFYCEGLKQSTGNTQCTFIKSALMCAVKQSACSGFTVTSLSTADKGLWCPQLKDLSGNKCAYSSGDSSCKQITCELIPSVSSQSDCNSYMSGCKYYGGYCFTSTSNCAILTAPSYITDKVAFCTNQINTSSQYCGANNTSTCMAPSSNCNSFTVSGTTSANTTYCLQRKNSNGYVCTFVVGNSFCSLADTSLSCTLIPTTPTSQEQCQQFSSNCSYLDSTQKCVLTTTLDTCDKYIFRSTIDEDTKLAYCQSVKSNVCTYQFGDSTCTDALSVCSSWSLTTVNDKLSYCMARKSGEGGCAWASTDGQHCRLIQCHDVITPTQQSDCDKKLSGCTFYSNSCYKQQTSCELYWGFGVDDAGKKAYCEGLSSSSSTLCTYIMGSQSCTSVVSSCNQYDVSTLLQDSDKSTWCVLMNDSNGKICTYTSGENSCSAPIQVCGSIFSPTTQNDCDSALPTTCLYYNSVCYTIQSNCTSYEIPSGETDKLLYCKNVYDSSNNYCSYQTGPNCSAFTSDCSDISATGADDNAKRTFCRKYKTNSGQLCGYSTGANCELETNFCSVIPSVTKQEDCDSRLEGCVYIQKEGICKQSYNIPDCSSMTFTSGLSNANRVTYCQGYQPSGNICTWVSANLMCEINSKQCPDYNAVGQADKRTYCLQYKSSTNNCAWRSGDTLNTCRDYGCQDIDNPLNQSDCDKVMLGCSFYVNSCFIEQSQCDKYFALGTDTSRKQQFCNGIISTTNQNCAYLTDEYKCRPRGACNTYNVSSISDKPAACLGMLDSAGVKCLYIKGNTCETTGQCNTYTGLANISNCTTLYDINQRACLAGTTTCKTFMCENIASPTSQLDCDNILKGLCYFTNSLCLTISTCDTYVQANWPSGVDPNTYCSTLKDINSHFCAANGSSSAACQERLCSDKSFYSNSECYSWKQSCKSDGSKCVEASKICSTFTGNQDSCSKYLDSDNLNSCKVIAGSDQSSGPCLELSCFQNTTATTDAVCKLYQNGCLTRGNGCIPNTATCQEYRGTKDQCGKFAGYLLIKNGAVVSEICSGDVGNNEQSPCRSRKCFDNVTDNTDALCDYFHPGCVTNGQGCIEKSASCSSYKGTQTQCSKFMGTNQTGYCWNIAEATSSSYCIDKQCTHIKSTTDSDCIKAFPNLVVNGVTTQLCVSNGANCIANPAKCSDFQGNSTTCFQFTANVDGPCKGTTNGNHIGQCTPRQCYDAPTAYDTDSLCQSFHPSCLTTGAGCMKYSSIKNGMPAISCGNIVSQSVCSLKIGCTQINSCLQQPQSCSQLTSQGQTICANTKLSNGNKCFFDLSINSCRDFQCSDESSSSVDHTICQKYGKNCTTNGYGCTIMQTCSYYSDFITCSTAYSTDTVNRCTWDNNSCRQRLCIDSSGLTKSVCNSFLSGCISNGQQCVGPQYQCSDLLKSTCLQDYLGNPCVYYDNQCYYYTKCSDLPFTTHSQCQSFSKYCTSDGNTCIALSKCANYISQVSCQVGIDGQCGWIISPAAKCEVFTQCSAVLASDTLICQQYSSTCISDGVRCVQKSDCASYGSELLCTNNNGTDGICIWNNSCRLKVCEDLTVNITTYDKCKNQLLPLQCSSDGTKCVSLSQCEYYQKASCFIGLDGPCIYRYPVGDPKGTVSCRLLECSDVLGKTLDACSSAVMGKDCVSNGINCVPKNTCSQYTAKLACLSGGYDGQCAFKPVPQTPNTGQCLLFTKCSDANSDKDSCLVQSNYCQWVQTETSKSCIAHTCSTYNTKSQCLPVPSLDQSSYILCSKVNSLCTEINADSLPLDICYSNSAQTYIWNTNTMKCESCNHKTDNSSTIQSSTTTGYAQILVVSIWLFIWIQF